MKQERGITLIALIITIIILVILAAVSIRAVYNMGIVNHAVNGTEGYAKAAKMEEETMQDTENFIEEIAGRIRNTQYGEDEPEEETVAFNKNGVNYTWKDINSIANLISTDTSVTSKSGSATVNYKGTSLTLNTGDIFDLVGLIGESGSEVEYTYKVRIIGFNTDILSNGGTRAGITFQFVNFFRWDGTTEYGQINASNTANGWGDCNLRTNLNLETTLGRLTNSRYIKTVDKKYLPTFDSSEQSTSHDKLWLLATSEIFPYNGDTIPKYGSTYDTESEVDENYNGQYKWYFDNVTSRIGALCLVKNKSTYGNNTEYGNSDAGYWWLRSQSYLSATGFCSIETQGRGSSGVPTRQDNISPGFCI